MVLRHSFVDNTLDIKILSSVFSVTCLVLCVILKRAINKRNAAPYATYELLVALGGESKYDEELSKHAQDALDTESATSEESKKAFKSFRRKT